MKYTGPLEKRPMIPYNDAPDGNIRFVNRFNTSSEANLEDTGYT